MYTNRRYTSGVRDGRARYGEDPLPSEDFPGAGALHDLSGAQASEIPLILARYAALRAWALRSDGAAPAVISHALSAAHDHLAAIEEEWPEREMLREALARGRGPRALTVLGAAATAADDRGHAHGARALREAVHRERWRGSCFPPPSCS